ncbi:MAG TPA: class I SAM-dependent methyltransferase [Acidimicrobiales bacterium]|nr:class I SAM-dependent methyltransferase [Acidimicrobiales bacterium]
MTAPGTDDYATLAADYHWLERDEAHALAVVGRHGGGERILDCACGTGTDVVALARAGHRVWASDGSGAMVEAARRRIAGAGVRVTAEECRWAELPGRFREPFDLVLCLGNSISHLRPDQRAPAFRGMAGVLAGGGRLVLNARNWEKLRRDRPRLTFPEEVVEREGRRCVPLYIWSYGDGWDAEHGVEIAFVVEASGRVDVRRHPLTFWPFTAADLHARLDEAGLRVVADDHDPEADWYEVVAERRGGP